MDSRIAKELKLRFKPVAILFSDERPKDALRFKEGARGCVTDMLTAAARGKVVVFDRKTTGCMGGKTGLCFGDAFAERREFMEYFLSTGGGPQQVEGEGYKKTPELAGAFMDSLPKVDIPYTYVIFKPLDQVDEARETPQVVTFYCNPDQLSAMVVLANYGRPSSDNVIIPFSAGCHTVCLLPYLEAQQERPRAVVGLTDISARPSVDADILSFSVPFKMLREMEADVPGSFLERRDWRKVEARIP